MVAKKVGMTTEKVQELQDTFYVFDQNGDGMITTDELATVLFKLGQRPTLREVQAMIKSVDADKSGTIDFDEFVKIFAQKMSIDPEKELHEIFCVFDKNKDGFISSEELYEVLSKLGESITKVCIHNICPTFKSKKQRYFVDFSF
ncbi:Hypothetical predicted protein [Mytilus galloprovincialis]|uniref:EF-hand domain-containing protein n=1 Tax=Mytilus galloprovincialis TaxID=29158 RepID=A0A8B6FKV2_MYTGA|nr:Hypothetical predicted protein [Mytilus galloprovincialis]